MKRVLILCLAVLIWRGSSGFAVWNQKPAQFWPRGSSFGGQLPRPDVSTNNVQTATRQTPSDSTGQSADSPNILNPNSCGTASLKPQLVPSQTGQLNSLMSPSQSGGPSVSLQQGGGSSQYTAQSSGFQGFAFSPQNTLTSGIQNQAFPSSSSSQGVPSGSASQQPSYDPSANGSNWFVLSGQGIPLVPQTQTLSPVPQVVQGSALQTQISQSSPQSVASVSAPSTQQQRYNQSAGGSSWFVSSGQGDPSVSQTLRPVHQVVWGSGPQTYSFQPSTQGVERVFAASAQQQSADQSARGSSWFVSSGQGLPQTPQTQTLRPVVQGFQDLPQAVAHIPAPSAQQQGGDQSASSSSWFISSGQRVPLVPHTQTLRTVPHVVQGLVSQTQVSQALSQGEASVSSPSAQQQRNNHLAGGFSGFGSLGQGVLSSQSLNAPVVQGSVPQSQASHQGVASVSAPSTQQQGYDQSASGSKWFGSLGQLVPSGQQTLKPVHQLVQGSKPQALPQGVASVSAPSAQQQSYDQSARGSSLFVSSRQGVSPVPQTLRPVHQVVQGSARWTQGSLASPQSVASVSAPSAQQHSYNQSAGGSGWFGSLGQGVLSSQGQNAPVVQGSALQTQASQATPQNVASIPAPLAQQQSYDQFAGGTSWFVSGQGIPLVPQTLRPVPQLVQGLASRASPQGVASVHAPSAQQQSARDYSRIVSGQGVSPVPQKQTPWPVVQGFQASTLGVGSVPAPSAQQQSNDQSAGGSRWFGSLGQGVPSSQGLNASVVQVSGPPTQVSQALRESVASASAPLAQQPVYDQSAGCSSWLVSSGQGVPSSQNAPVSQTQTLRPLPQVVEGSGPRASPQGVAGVSASPAQQWNYDQAASWVASQVQGPSPSSTAVQTQQPEPAAGNVANLFTTAQGTSSWHTPPQRSSSILTQFQRSQNAAPVSQASQSPVPKKRFNVMPSGFTPSWSSGSPSAWVTASSNPYASLSQVAVPSADAMFQSGGLGSSFQPSAVSTTNSAVGSSSLSQTSWPPAAVVSSGPISISALPSQNTWQSTGPSQAVLQGSSTVPAASSNLLSSVTSRVPISYPRTTSSSNFLPSQASDASAQRVPVNQLNFNKAGTSSGSSVVLPSFTRAVKG